MIIENKKLIKVEASDVNSDGLFFNEEIMEVGDDCLCDLYNLKKLVLPNCISIGILSIRNNFLLESIELNKCEMIKYGCFCDNKNLKSILIGDNNLDVKCVCDVCFIIKKYVSDDIHGGVFTRVHNGDIYVHDRILIEKNGSCHLKSYENILKIN